ncbi:MAG: ABC transporter ATP-binding protein [Christensenellales bacterium]
MKITNLCKRYGEKIVLDHLTLELPDAGVVALLGPSGCGKTTLLRILAGLEKADSGTVSGLEVKKISMMFQEDRLLPWATARENVAFVDEESDPLVYLEAVGLGEEGDVYPEQLSGGMQRRLALARTLHFSGDVYLLDEPFKGLDAAIKKMVMKAAAKRTKNKLVLFVTHDEQEAKMMADQVISFAGPPLTAISRTQKK